jgi:hypothetical protein
MKTFKNAGVGYVYAKQIKQIFCKEHGSVEKLTNDFQGATRGTALPPGGVAAPCSNKSWN